MFFRFQVSGFGMKVVWEESGFRMNFFWDEKRHFHPNLDESVPNLVVE